MNVYNWIFKPKYTKDEIYAASVIQRHCKSFLENRKRDTQIRVFQHWRKRTRDVKFIKSRTATALSPSNLTRRTCDLDLWRTYIKERSLLVQRIVEIDDYVEINM